jgi:tape measure domain-containing protein
MFKLFDGYSRTADVIEKKTQKATDKILKASGATDNFNRKLEQTGASAAKGSSGLGKFISIAAMIAGAVKGMNIADEYTNTAARLDLINDGLQTQAELQNKIYAAANRSRGAYTDIAGAISKMGLLAGDDFSSNDELIAFTELVQKSFKVSGASQSEQSSALLQLTQAMSAGKLQGDEFRSIMENAPMIADAIAKYTGKSKGELKELSSQGLITSDIIKNAMFMAADDINAKFDKMPRNFSDVWNRIKNGALKAFDKVITKVNTLINTDRFHASVDRLMVGFNLAAGAASWLIDVIVNGWDTIGPILAIIAAVYLVGIIAKLWAMVPPLIAQAAAWLSIYWPILLIIAIIGVAISAARQFGASWEDIFGFVGGIIGTFAAFFYNNFVQIWDIVAAFINFFGNVFKNPVASIKVLFLDLAMSVLGYIEKIAKGIEDLLNKIPGVNVNITSGITGLMDKLSAKAADIRTEADLKTYVKSKEFMDYSEGFTRGSKMGKDITNNISGAFGDLKDLMTTDSFDLGDFGASNKPLNVQGEVKVNMSDEDLKYLRDIAEREYINKFSTATLAPSINFTFGDIHETADVNALKSRLEDIMREEIALASEGVY